MDDLPPRERLSQLFDKIEAFFEAARSRHGPAIACGAGCNDCCHRRFSITAIEAAVIRDGLASLAPAKREELACRARAPEPPTTAVLPTKPSACPALDADGRCAIYAVRPVICRTHGLAIRYARQDSAGRRALPVVDACPRNFVGQDLQQIDAASTLDQTTLSTILGALDAADAERSGRPRGERIDIATVLAG